eukprot:7100166-Karenia_brevis.AAC.1
MQQQETPHALPADFNEGFLSCIPKKPTGVDEHHGAFYAAKDTRPLAVVNTDNRLIAGAYRYLFQPIAEQFVSKVQKAFLPGRPMIANVVDVDFESMRISLSCDRGALILFDFSAAFPSLSHQYMWSVLEHIGVPGPVLSAFKAFYVNNALHLKLDGGLHGTINASRGVRQGCPLSPLLFVVVVDVLLRRLSRLHPSCIIRAFADDIALLTPCVYKDASSVMHIFRDFGKMSGLELNLPKCEIIPLWESSVH